MIGDGLMKGLIGFYLVLACVYAAEQHWAKCTDWLGAAIIAGSVLAMR